MNSTVDSQCPSHRTSRSKEAQLHLRYLAAIRIIHARFNRNKETKFRITRVTAFILLSSYDHDNEYRPDFMSSNQIMGTDSGELMRFLIFWEVGCSIN